MDAQLGFAAASAFLLTLLFVCVLRDPSSREGFAQTSYCANVLTEVDGKLHLRNTARAEVPGVNPIVFDNLEGYVEYVEWQRSQGLVCPVLYLAPTEAPAPGQVRQVLIVDPADPSQFVAVLDPDSPALLVDANHTGGPFNAGSYPGFDAQDQQVGEVTVLDVAYPASTPLAAS
jgi:hypothetical protein